MSVPGTNIQGVVMVGMVVVVMMDVQVAGLVTEQITDS